MLLKSVMKTFLAIHVFFYRLSKGAIMGSVRGTPVLLLTTTGRKSGKTRTLPLGYIKDGDNYLLMASNGGSNQHPGWYFNLKSNPQATIEIKGEKKTVKAEVATGDERTRLWKQFIEAAPAYAAYEKANREIPLMILRV